MILFILGGWVEDSKISGPERDALSGEDRVPSDCTQEGEVEFVLMIQ